eukprot:8071994-Pyramimonas_sp.AAC.1
MGRGNQERKGARELHRANKTPALGHVASWKVLTPEPAARENGNAPHWHPPQRWPRRATTPTSILGGDTSR